MNFKGKKLLVLGTATSSCDIVEYAKSKGAYTIVADYLEDSEAKKIADKSYLISTADVDALCTMAKEEGVNGVISGAHEFNIRKSLELSERLELDSYITLEQWDITSNKLSFKKLCRKNNVPVVKEYNWADIQKNMENVEYPVIVKPVDGSGASGISIVQNESELYDAVNSALEESIEKKVIIEEYLEGQEVVLYYTAQDGHISLSAMCDRYTNKDERHKAPLPTVYIFPSAFLGSYLENENKKVCRMFEELGIRNAFFFLQGFIVGNEVVFYEMGLRIAGAQGHRIVAEMSGFNPLEMLVDYTLTGKFGDCKVADLDNPNFKQYACKWTPLLKKGKISKIIGLEEITSWPEVFAVANVHKEGDEILGTGTLRDLLTRIYIKSDTKESLKLCLEKAQKCLKVLDAEGNSLLREDFDTKILL